VIEALYSQLHCTELVQQIESVRLVREYVSNTGSETQKLIATYMEGLHYVHAYLCFVGSSHIQSNNKLLKFYRVTIFSL